MEAISMALSASASANKGLSGIYHFSGNRNSPRGCFTLHNGDRVFFKKDDFSTRTRFGNLLGRLTLFKPRDSMNNLVRFYLSCSSSLNMERLLSEPNTHMMVGVIKGLAAKNSAREELLSFVKSGPPYSLPLVYLFDRVLPDYLSP